MLNFALVSFRIVSVALAGYGVLVKSIATLGILTKGGVDLCIAPGAFWSFDLQFLSMYRD
jgi:hypothetical protein